MKKIGLIRNWLRISIINFFLNQLQSVTLTIKPKISLIFLVKTFNSNEKPKTNKRLNPGREPNPKDPNHFALYKDYQTH